MIDSSTNKRDFFVSFNKADRAWAAWIAWVLEEKGYSVFFQDWDFKGNFVLEMDKAHAQSRRTIAVLSPDYLASRFTAPEWAARFAQDATSEHDLLLPVRVRPCNLEGLLAQIVYVDLVGCSEEEARRKLLQRVEGIRLKPDEPPLFPGQASHDVPERPAFPMAVPMGEKAMAQDIHPARKRAVPTTWLVAALALAALVVAIGLVVFRQGNTNIAATDNSVAAGRDATGITINKDGAK
ncbi:toll/interleukin-1 receptor domain-containing protein [Methylobacterium nodulans]|uniref:TIR protein n=1 Tax=Methylobacterium nodulans (strain LMG 21967 / CNCM I-2342 / ORS 2060) TaxID=460265 RepID=B8IV87_METNO|nr:toll/interleukin-1 receptor domain-containing protein [Methylobacterium nodulans]ACL60938.1 TIR protein [Methylobacterium nodulans ORS 2060]